MSCEGHRVGPLSDRSVEQIQGYWRVLAPQYLRVSQNPATITAWTQEGEALHFLNFPDERCVFLHDRRCLLHERFGADAKPSPCQRFPQLTVNADGQLRAGLRPVCYRWHHTFDTEPAPTPLQGVSQTPSPPQAPELLALEQEILCALASPVDLVGLLWVLARGGGGSGVLSSQSWREVASILREVARCLLPVPKDLAKTGHGGHVLEVLNIFKNPRSEPPPPPPPRLLRYILAGLHQVTYLRLLGPISAVPRLLTLAVMGILALWADECGLGDPNPVDISDRFTARLVAWHRVLAQGSFHTRVLGDAQWEAWCGSLKI